MLVLYGGFCLVLIALLVMILTPVFRSRDFTIRQRYLMAGTLFVFFFAILFGVYYSVGAPEVVPMVAEQQRRIQIIRNSITQLSQAVKEHPDDAASWMGLGDDFMMTGQNKGAVNAYQQAVKLTGGNPKAILAYAQALVAEAEGRVTDEAKKSLDMVLMQDPKNAPARYLMAVSLLQSGKTEQAMKDMREPYYSLPDGDETKALIDKQIGNNHKPALNN